MEDKFNKEVRVLREDGSYTWTHVNLIVKTYAPERNSVELICINYDITRLKTTEAMLIDAKEKSRRVRPPEIGLSCQHRVTKYVHR